MSSAPGSFLEAGSQPHRTSGSSTPATAAACPQAVCGQALSLWAIVYLDGAPAALGLLLGILITGAGSDRMYIGCSAIQACDRACPPSCAAAPPASFVPPCSGAARMCSMQACQLTFAPWSSSTCNTSHAVNACLGVSGCVFRDVNQLAGHVVAGVLCLCLVLSYISQVGARTGDC